MDTLLRGDVSRRFGEDAAAYDQHMNRFAASIAAGVAPVLLGIILMLFIAEFFFQEMWAGVVFFLFLIAAVTIFIISGMGHDVFLRQHPGIGPCYSKEEMDRFERRFPFLIAVPVALILLGLLAVFAIEAFSVPIACAILHTDAISTPHPLLYRIEAVSGCIFLLCITISASALTWAGIQHSKYGFPEEKPTPAERRVGRVWGVGMVAATALYVGLGLGLDLWKQAAAVIYTVAALLCVAVTILVKKDDEP